LGKIAAPKTFVPPINCSLTIAPPKKSFEVASAKAYDGAHGIKRFFAVIQPKNLGGRPPKKMKKNGLIDANTSAIAAAPVPAAPDSPPDSPLIVDVLVMTKKKEEDMNQLEERRAS